MYYDKNSGKTVIQTGTYTKPPAKSPRGVVYSNAPAPWAPKAPNPTASSSGYFSGNTRPAATPTRAPQQGLLSTPGALEGVWGGIQNRLESPSLAGAQAAWASPQLQNKGYLEQLYESGWDNPWYARARDQGMRDIENRMSAAGVFGSGAT